jgi:BMFP domain-containing protein YqiC
MHAISFARAAVSLYQDRGNIWTEPMTAQNRLLDELAKFMTDAAGAARGVQQEVTTLVRGQAERLVSDMDLVNREAFEAVKAMAVKAREENAALEKRIAALEAALAKLTPPG